MLEILGRATRSEESLASIAQFTLPDTPEEKQTPASKRVKTDVSDGCVVVSRLELLEQCLRDPSRAVVASMSEDRTREDVLRTAVITASQRLTQLSSDVRSLQFRLKQSQREVAALKAEQMVSSDADTQTMATLPKPAAPVPPPVEHAPTPSQPSPEDPARAREIELLRLQLQSRQEAVEEAEAETLRLRNELERVREECSQQLADGAARERKAAWDADAESKRNASLEAAVREEGKRADRERVKSETLLASVEADMKSNAKEMHEKEEASAAQIAKLEKELQKTKSERDAFERKLKRHKLFAEVLETMEATIQKLTKVIAAPSAVADPSSREKILRQQVTDMSTSLTQLNTTVHKVQKLVVFGDKKNDQLQEEVLAQQKQAETQREELETQRTALETAQKEAKEAKEDAARLRSANESLEKAAQRLSDEVGGLRAELLEMVTGEDSFQARWKKESAENERLRARVAELGKEAANWRLDVKKERIRFERRLIASRSSEEKEVLELMQEEMQRYKAELLCPVCHRAPKDCILCKCQHIFCRECVEERISVRERRRRDV